MDQGKSMSHNRDITTGHQTPSEGISVKIFSADTGSSLNNNGVPREQGDDACHSKLGASCSSGFRGDEACHGALQRASMAVDGVLGTAEHSSTIPSILSHPHLRNPNDIGAADAAARVESSISTSECSNSNSSQYGIVIPVDWHKPPVVALLETKMQDHLPLLNDYPFNRIIEVPAVGNAGGLAVLWDDSLLELDDIATTDQEIHTLVKCNRAKQLKMGNYLTWSEAFPFHLWNIWLSRNDKLFNRRRNLIPINLGQAQAIEFKFLAGKHKSTGRNMVTNPRWKPPDEGLKLNVDGSYDANSNDGGGRGDLLQELGITWVQREDRRTNGAADILAKEGRKKESTKFLEEWTVPPLFIRQAIAIDKEGTSFDEHFLEPNSNIVLDVNSMLVRHYGPATYNRLDMYNANMAVLESELTSKGVRFLEWAILRPSMIAKSSACSASAWGRGFPFEVNGGGRLYGAGRIHNIVERFAPKVLPGFNPVMATEGGRIERGNGDVFRRNSILEGFGFRALKEDVGDVFFWVSLGDYSEMTPPSQEDEEVKGKRVLFSDTSCRFEILRFRAIYEDGNGSGGDTGHDKRDGWLRKSKELECFLDEELFQFVKDFFKDLIGENTVVYKMPRKFLSAAKLSSPINCLKSLCLSGIYLDESVELFVALCLIRSFPYLQDIQMKFDYSDELFFPLSGDVISEIPASFTDVTLNHLRSVKLEGISGTKTEIEFINLLLAKSPMLVRMLIQPKMANESAETRLKVRAEITKFPRASTKAEVDYRLDDNRV
ncbi:hypothetical protein T459_26923 [Capsicum annuum]|uniref:FBD domain-containing protein n=1 Tax=Capsicum annuum TaxID=4072 RepID=A0A2G2YCG9_CAPAN|nr:hypothetical protein T459_26923 [Capsicum annuum]